MKNTNEPPIHIDQQVDLLEYLDAILRSKYRLMIAAIFAAAAVFGLSKFVDDKYTATSIVAININENPGGVSPESYRGNDTIGLLEHEFLIDAAPSNEIDRLLAKINGFEFIKTFIVKENLLQIIFKDKWDVANNEWIDDFEPDYRLASKILKDEYLILDYDEKSGLLKVKFTSLSPDLSAKISNVIPISFNSYLKNKTVDSMNVRRGYLEKRLSEVSNIEVQRSIYRLLEAQLGMESIIHARNDYPLEIIQPATSPLFKSYPSRKKWTVLTFFGVFFFGLFLVVGNVIFGKMKTAISLYKKDRNSKNLNQSEDIWIDN
ncbi:Chain length determinant protein [Marinobacterium sp. xm-d-579]|uniref:hypothetical protein n=1 Tax=Marinobacterium sp. xm-d-579 TaxID=2497734 RepID=UPI001569CBA0|nr:hypothetical protein [Marinobacterium sp. xm-d-579]NRP36355.1 Chain length determinant protein [Marinobacterium sp. xm-d-579]